MNQTAVDTSKQQQQAPEEAFPEDLAMPKAFASFREQRGVADPRFVRPDRQTNFDGAPPYDWPEPQHDKTTLSVDRVGDTTEEGPHRFTICLKDRVRVWLGPDRFETGTVVAISPTRQSARVQSIPGKRGLWHSKEKLYPAPVKEPTKQKAAVAEAKNGSEKVNDKKEEALKLAEQGLTELNEALKAGNSETLVKYLTFLSKFHNYSFQNCILISIQRPDATQVAGYNRWKQLGRQVKKGEKGITILGPVLAKRNVEVEDENQEAQNKTVSKLIGFRTLHVFDVSQTEGKDLPEFAQISGDPGEAIPRLEKLIQDNDIALQYEFPGGGALGTSSGGTITVRPDLSLAETLSVLVHELAHEFLHQGERRHETDKTVRETEAEAVAFTVCNALGLETKTRSADYIKLYRGDPQVLQESLHFIQKTAARIIEALT